jgi:hypothetical protein
MIALLFKAGIFLDVHATGQSTDPKPYLIAAGGSAAIPDVPQNAGALIDAFRTVLTQACQPAYSRGRQLSTGWQQQVAATGPAEYAKSLVAFRNAAAVCIQQFGAVINGASRSFPDIVFAVAGSWTFAPTLWIATNNFASVIVGDRSSPVAEHIAKAAPESQEFATALGQFSTWISDTETRLAAMQNPPGNPAR